MISGIEDDRGSITWSSSLPETCELSMSVFSCFKILSELIMFYPVTRTGANVDQAKIGPACANRSQTDSSLLVLKACNAFHSIPIYP